LLGQQLGLGQNLFSSRAATMPPKNYLPIYIGSAVALLAIIMGVVYCVSKPNKNRKVSLNYN
jgi:hypothetical protein